jgi:transcriptional regulator with XRE-family HTH domain
VGYPVQLVDAKPLRDLIKYHNLSVPEIATRTGLSTSALYTWERKGKMPAYMRNVCRGILADLKGERGEQSGSRPENYFVQLPPDKAENAIKLLEAIGAKIRSLDNI